MNEQEALLSSHLRAYRRRIKVLLAGRMLIRGVIAAALLGLLLILTDLFIDRWYVTLPILLGLLVLGALAGALVGFLRPLDDLSVAMAVDRRLELKDRSSTALALTTDVRSLPEFRELVIGDALAHLAGHRPQEVFTARFNREHKIALGLCAALLVAFFLPSLPFWYTQTTQADRANMVQAGKVLQQQAKKIERDPAVRNNKKLVRLARHMRKLGKELEKNRLPKKEALKRINKLNQEAAKAQQELAKNMFQVSAEDLKSAADAFQRALDARSKAEKDAAKRAREKLAKGARPEQLSKEEREALEREQQLQQIVQQLQNGQLDEATESLRQFGQHLAQASNLSEQQRSALASAMNQMASATRGSQEISQKFQQAAKGLKQNTAAGQQQAASALQSMPTVVASRVAANEMSNSVNAAKQQLASMSSGQFSNSGNMNGNNGSSGMMGNNSMNSNGMNNNGMNGNNGTNNNGTNNNGMNGNSGNNGMNNNNGNNGNTSSNCNGANCRAGTCNGGTCGRTGANAGRTGGGNNPSGTRGGGGGRGGGGLRANNTGSDFVHGRNTMNPTGMNSSNRSVTIDTNLRGAPGDNAQPSSVPYYDVYNEYRNRAETAITNEQVPVSERRRVKDYFTALDPNAENP